MNKILYTLSLLFIFNFLSAQTVTPIQTMLLTKRTADWCPNCGTWGWNFTKLVNDKTKDQDIIFWNVHHSGGLNTPTSSAMAANIGGFAQPVFFVNTDTEDLGVTSGNQNAKLNDIVDALGIYKSQGAFVGMGSDASVDSKNKVTVNAKIKFYEAVNTGEYFIGAYIVKKNLVHQQASVGASAVHHSVLSESLTPTAVFGKSIAKGPIAANKEFTTNFTYDDLKLHNGKLSDTKIVVVLWKYDTVNKKYVFNNAREVSINSILSSTKDEIANLFDFTPVLQGGKINLSFNQEINNPVVSMVDITGKKIQLSTTQTSSKTVEVEALDAPAGNYIIKVEGNKTYKAKQIYYTKQ
jgi:hypothetical protein